MIPAPPLPPAYEICNIKYQIQESSIPNFRPSRLQFYADAIGPQGRYTAAVSREFFGWEDHPAWRGEQLHEQHDAFLNELIQLLTYQGWEPLGNPEMVWFNYHFRRVVQYS